MLVREGYITPEQLGKACEAQKQHDGPLGAHLVSLGCLTEEALLAYLQKEYRLATVDPLDRAIPEEVAQLVPPALVKKYHLLPGELVGSTLTLAMADPSNLVAVDEIKFLTGYNIKVSLATHSAIQRMTEQVNEQAMKYDEVLGDLRGQQQIEVLQEQEGIDLNELEQATQDVPVVRLVNAIFTDALKKRASDIHIGPYEKNFRVRFRIDGVLHEILQTPVSLRAAVVSRIKVMATLEIAERRLPQDGRIKIELGPGAGIALRVSVLPTLFGEKVVMRILDKSNLQLNMEKLGFEPQALKIFREAIYKPYGMVLVTGPISTAEDPVEYTRTHTLPVGLRCCCPDLSAWPGQRPATPTSATPPFEDYVPGLFSPASPLGKP